MLSFRNRLIPLGCILICLACAPLALAERSATPQTFLDYQRQIQSGAVTPQTRAPSRIEAPVMSMQQWGTRYNSIGRVRHRDAGKMRETQTVDTAVMERRVIFTREHDQARQTFLRADQSRTFRSPNEPFSDRPVRTAALGSLEYADEQGKVDFDQLNRNVFRRNRPTDPASGDIPAQRAGGGADPR